MNHMPRFLLIVLAIAGAGCSVSAGEPSNWSSYAGDGDFVPVRQGLELTDDPANIRVAWKNPTHTGIIKSGGGTALKAQKAGFDPAYGEAANLIVADGVVFCSWSQPSGKGKVPRDRVDHRYWDKSEKAALPDKFFSVDADWHTIAIDAKTGRTLWEKREASASMHFIPGKRSHHGISGAYGNGMYATMTILGEVFAYDASSGKLRWKTTVPEWHKWTSKVKDERMQERKLVVTVRDNPFSSQRRGLAIVGDVVVVPDLRGGITGFNAKNGKRQWHVPQALERAAVPQIWRHNGKAWLLCNGPKGRDRDSSRIRLIDPENGNVAWSHDSGANRGCLVFGDDHLILNVRGDDGRKEGGYRKGAGLLACYRVSPDGLTEAWRFKDQHKYIYRYNPDAGAHRKGAIRDGVLYIALGHEKSDRHVRSFDLASGRELDHDPQQFSVFTCQPILAEDRMFWQKDPAHSGSFAGYLVYQLEKNGKFTRLGSMKLKPNGVYRIGGYEHAKESPYYNGYFYMRGLKGIYAVSVRTVTSPMAKLKLNGAWAGSPVPLRCRLFANDDGIVQTSKVRPPAGPELGVVYTTGRRGDGWAEMTLQDKLNIRKGGSATATFGMISHSWEGEITLKRDNNKWTGTWKRTIPAWDHKPTAKGKITNGLDGYDARMFPTPWLKHQPMTKMGDLPKGQQRILMTLPGFLPKGGRADDAKPLTLCLDHDGERFVSGVGGAFSFNQGWHEVDLSGLELTEDGLKGTLTVIVNPDPWWAPNQKKGTAIAGRVKIEATFGKTNDKGLRAVKGTWTASWGERLERSGKIEIFQVRNAR